MIDEERFGGIARLYGVKGAERLAHAHVAVVGIGGVGSWAAEALARSGVGTLILQDMDDLCITNTNRQIHALQGNYGMAKVEVMAQRLRLINPAIEVEPLLSFYTVSKPERLFDTRPDVVIDAIDSMRPKTHLIAECYKRGVPIVTCGGAVLLCLGRHGVFLKGSENKTVVTEHINDLCICVNTESTDKDCHGDLTVLIDTNAEYVV